ncbi:MAG: FKBP-type peptidyl-prolyl cis-trans isomerase [Nanoarchaeota archaeon]|nr:peptidylprolyl isomerase [Nanoarchaeota archaeon]MBU4300444.1 peptidylprolyl isomerase [Nanoarchaeota archaeon]MBU4452117.1 peptidylprolyl isomerase [Nanoarchaeota archaeon]MCG2724615.1 peptidylprolyl isomerase [archaeon]
MENGTFVQIEYLGKIKESGEIFDLTYENIAKEKKIYNPNVNYGPITIILGNKQILASLDSKIKEMNVGEKKTIVLETKEAFGERSAEFVKIIPLSNFTRQNMHPQVGQFITLANNLQGRVLSVSSGRVKIDFNHPLAGKELEYEVVLNKIVEKPEEKVSAVFLYYSNTEAKSVSIDPLKGTAKIELPSAFELAQNGKKKISDEIILHVSGIKEVSFVENFEKSVTKSSNELEEITPSK